MMKKMVGRIISVAVIVTLMIGGISFGSAESSYAAGKAPAPPKNIKATAQSTSVVKLTWNKVSGAKNYIVYMKSAGKYVKILSPKKNSVKVSQLRTNTTYYFKLAVKTKNGTSKLSKAVKVKTKNVSTPSTPGTPGTDPGSPTGGGVTTGSGVTTDTALAAPAGFKLSSSTTTAIILAWSAVTGTAKYNIYMATSSAGPYSLKTSSTGTTATITGLTANTTYYFKIAAVDTAGKEGTMSPVLTAATANPAAAALAAPAGFKSSSVTTTAINLTWNAVTGASKYNVYMATSSAGPYSLKTSPTGTLVTINGLTANTTYYFKIAAVDSAGKEGTMSAVISVATAKAAAAALAAPAGFKSSSVTTTSISLMWNAVTGASKYNVYMATSSAGPYSLKTSPTGTTATITGLTANTTYYFKIAAVDSAGKEGTMSAVISVATAKAAAVTPLPAPANFRVTSSTTNAITLEWNAVTGASSYNIYVASSSGGSYSKIGNTTVNYYGVAGRSPGTTLYYKVAAVSSSNVEGTMSAAIAGTTTTAPATPSQPAPNAPAFSLYSFSTSGSNVTNTFRCDDTQLGVTSYKSYYRTLGSSTWTYLSSMNAPGSGQGFNVTVPAGTIINAGFTALKGTLESAKTESGFFAALAGTPYFSNQPGKNLGVLEVGTTPGGPYSINLQWLSVGGASGYIVAMTNQFTDMDISHAKIVTRVQGSGLIQTSVSAAQITAAGLHKPIVWGGASSPGYFIFVIPYTLSGGTEYRGLWSTTGWSMGYCDGYWGFY